jgi:hypothetical protein
MYRYLDREGYTVLFSLTLSFAIGVALAPWSNGLLWILIYAIALEVILMLMYGKIYSGKMAIYRFSLFCSSFLGYGIGRTVIGDRDPLPEL